MKLLHFADAHIDMANYGRHDPQTGLPLRVLDFLKSLDTIVEAALSEKVDMVIFAGDAYKDRSPAPTFQREWGRRIIRLSQAGIPTFLLVGNHDMSPAVGRAHSIQEFDTLQIPHVRVLQKPQFISAEELGLPVQIIALPWVSRSGLMAALEISGTDQGEIFDEVEKRLSELVEGWLEDSDPDLPVVMAAHVSVQGASYGSERTVMLGSDLVLSGSMVKDKRLDYVALGHIHKPQNLNEGAHPPVIYPGSIERVDFGEATDDKFFVIAEVARGQTQVEWRKLEGVRPFIDRRAVLGPALPAPVPAHRPDVLREAQVSQLEGSSESVTEQLKSALPPVKELENAIVRLTVEYPREWDALIDDAALRKHAENAFEFHLVKRPQVEARIRLPADQTVSSLSPLDLLDQYWRATHTENAEELQKLAQEILSEELDT